VASQTHFLVFAVTEKNQKASVSETGGMVVSLPFWKLKAHAKLHGEGQKRISSEAEELRGECMSDFRFLKNQELIDKLQVFVSLEKKTTAEIVAVIAEVDRRKLFLDLGHTSLFSYLTTELGHTPASAQRRIDAARMLSVVPELKTDLQTGALNLMQISVVSQGLRQKKKEDSKVSVGVSEKREILMRVKGLDLMQTQRLVSQALDLDVQIQERKHVQKDESLRVELTLSKEQQARLQRAREILSHKHPSLGWAELFSVLAEDFMRRRDPRREPKCRAPSENLSRRPKNTNSMVSTSNSTSVTHSTSTSTSTSTSNMEAVLGQKSTDKQDCFESAWKPVAMADQHRIHKGDGLSKHRPRIKRKAVPLAIKREIFRRDRDCQWRDPITKTKCRSRFQLEVDHLKPVSVGGKNHPTNLQILCDVHNRLKWERRSRGIEQRRSRASRGRDGNHTK